MQKIVVTGGAGFIGSHLCEYLVKTGLYDVTCIDNYFTGTPDNHIHGVTYIEGNACNIAALIDFSPDYVFHFGEYSRVEQSFKDVKKTLTYNFGPMRNILEFCKYHDSKLVYSGSSTKLVIMAKTVMRRHTLGPRPRIRN